MPSRWGATLLLVPTLVTAQVARIEIAETAGLRRFGYPVRARINTPLPADGLRLAAGYKPIAAQFTRMDQGAVEVDFSVDLGPRETRGLVVEKGAPIELSKPMSVDQTATSYRAA